MGNCLQYMGNCLQYICPSSNEQKEPEVSVTAAKEEQHATETKASDKPEAPCEKTGRSASCALPSVDVDLPVLTVLGLEGKPQAKNADRNMAENQEKPERTETKDGVQIASGLQVFFFQSSSDSSLPPRDGAKTEVTTKVFALPSPKQLYRNTGAFKGKETGNSCSKQEEKSKTSMRKKLHLPKLKMKPIRRSRKVVPLDDGTTGGLPLMRGADEDCELTLRKLKPLDVVHSQMPSRALKADEIFLAVHQNAPKEQMSSSDEGLVKQEKEEVKVSSLPDSLRLPSWKEMYRRLIKRKELAANKHVENLQKRDQEGNGGKLPARKTKKKSRAHRERRVRTVEEEDVNSGLPLFRGCDVLESTQAVLFEVEDAGYLASCEESDSDEGW